MHIGKRACCWIYGNLCLVSEDRRTVVADYPSEPMLAEAATQVMSHEELYSKILSVLYTYIKAGMVTGNSYSESSTFC